MVPPLHAICASDTSVASLLGSGSLLRLYPFGEARQKETYPYAVWRTISGSPENYLADRSDMDAINTQIDVYAKTWRSAREVAAAIRVAIEDDSYVVDFNEGRDPITNSFRVTLFADWLTER